LLFGVKKFWNLVSNATFGGVRVAAAAAAASLVLWVGILTPAAAGYDEGAAAFIRGDYQEAWREWLVLGERGHQSAQYNLGVLYSIGLGVEQDDIEASKWFRRAADRGLPAAQMRLGTAYREGKGVPEDLKEAYFWFTLAATHFSLGEQHEQAVAARESTGAGLTRAQITEVLEKAMVWKPLPQTVDESDKERLIAEPNGESTVIGGGGAQDGVNSQGASSAGSQPETTGVQSGGISEASAIPEQDRGEGVLQAQAAEIAEAPTKSSETGVEAANGQKTAGEQMAGEGTAGAPSAQAESDEAAPQEMAAAGNGTSGQAETPAETAAIALAEPTESGGADAQAAAMTPNLTPRVSFAAHLSSVRSEDGTTEEWRSLQNLFPELLAGKTLTVRTIEVPDKGTFYRVMAGMFDNFDAAQAFCDKLQASDQYCVVRRLVEDNTQ
jgi:uncharacterized protein